MCNVKMSTKNLFETKFCCGLKLTNNIPKALPNNKDNVNSLKFIDKLKDHSMFYIKKYGTTFKKESDNNYIIVKEEIKEIPRSESLKLSLADERLTFRQIVAYTDGSCYKGKMSSGGICFVNGHLYNLHNDSFMSPLPHSNKRAEIFAIYRCLNMTNKPELKDIKITIRTDSKYSIDCVYKWFDKFSQKGFKKKDGSAYKNIDLIWAVKEEMKGRDVELSWVKGHASYKYNEIADDLSGKELDKLKRIFNI